eukprot:scaffold425429_cov138-Attheya_sp.AAC.1
MEFTTNSVKGFTSDFPHPILPKIYGEPNRDSLIAMHRHLCENTAYVTTNMGGRSHGLITLLLSDTVYKEQTKR